MENMIYYKDFNLDKFNFKAKLFFDTESSLAHKKFNKPGFPNREKVVHVYAWAISNSMDDIVIYGENLAQFFEFFDSLILNEVSKAKNGILTNKAYKELTSNLSFELGVHNLAWDSNFLLFYLQKHGYKQHLSEIININTEEKSNPKFLKKNYKVKQLQKTFTVVENNGMFYSMNVKSESIPVKFKEKKEIVEGQVSYSLNFWDTYKVQSSSLSDIAKKCIKIDDRFKKGENYDYEKIRKVGHKLSKDELEYLYNDVYILKEWYNQAYLSYKTQRKTISGISFESYLKQAYGEDLKNSERMKIFHEFFPPLSSTNKKLVDESYKGGWTQSNRAYTHKTIEINKRCLSVDINSSYPSVIAYKPLPYGTPTLHMDLSETEKIEIKEYVKKSVKEIEGLQTSTKKMKLIAIQFDGFRNKDKDNLIGEIQIGAQNKEDFIENFKEYKINSAREYFHTNIIGGEERDGKIFNYETIGTNEPQDQRRIFKRDYRLVLWEHELANILENTEFLIQKNLSSTGRKIKGKSYLEVGYDVVEYLEFDCQVGHFKKAVDYYVELKKEGKSTKNKVLELIAKAILNSFYGKLASDNLREERLLYLADCLVCFKSEKRYYTDDEEYYPAFSSAVTSWGRVNLRQQLYTIGYNKVVYFDTDSLYTLVSENELREKMGNMLHKYDLGKWDIEKEYTKIKTIGAKKYLVYGTDFKYDYKKNCKKVKINKSKKRTQKSRLPKNIRLICSKITCKCAGLPGEARKNLNFDNFKLGHECQGKKQKVKVKGGYLITEQVYKITDFDL